MRASTLTASFGSLLLLSQETVALTFPRRAHGPTNAYNASVPRWEWWPNPGPFSNGDKGLYLTLPSGVKTWYTTFGKKSSTKTPVLLLHGGTGNSNQMYHQANHLALTRQVILQDTRGEGRSPYENFTTFHYDDFTRDAIALLDHLGIPKVAVVGWSDGAITGLDLAMNYSSRIERVFAHGANIQANMSLPGLDDPIINSDSGGLGSDEATNGTTYSTSGNFTRRAAASEDPYACENISPTPGKCDAMEEGVALMWNVEPTWGPAAMATIKCPVWAVDGDHDIDVERNQADAIAAWVPYAGQLILPQVGHGAPLEDPKFFNFAVEYFLDMSYDDVLPYY